MNGSAFLLFMALLLVVGTSAGQDQPPPEQDEVKIRLTSNLVLLNVTVTNADQGYIGDLGQDDFRVFEDGVEQTIAYFGSEQTPFAVCIVVDVSGSMQRMARIAFAAARNFADQLRANDVFAVYVFDHRVAQIQDFGSYPELDERIWGIEAAGYTALYDAIHRAVEDLGQRPERRRAILVLSDGADTRSRHTLNDCLKAASDASVTMYTVNLMDRALARRPEALSAAGALRQMAQKTGGRHIDDPGGSQMYQAFKDIVEELGRQYTLGYFPIPAKDDGQWHTIEVRVSRPGVTVRTREGYRAAKRTHH